MIRLEQDRRWRVAAGQSQLQLAGALKQMRARSGLSTNDLSRALGWTQTRVSRTENATRTVSLAEVTAWADATAAPEDLRAEAIELAERIARDVRSWWSVHASGLAGRQHEIAALEASARLIKNCQHIIPGLLQTAEYARHALALANVSSQSDLAAAVAARMRRQEVLYDSTKRFEYVLPEAALRVRLADDVAMRRAQADRLISADSLTNVSVSILPFSEPLPTWPSAFVIYDIPGQPLVVVETLTTEMILGDERDVTAYRDAFARMRAAAVTGEAAHDLIRQAMIG